MLGSASLVVPGEPVPQQRARKGRGHWYTPDESREYRDRVQAAWMVEGRPWLGDDGPLELRACFVLSRKRSHLRRDGQPRSSAPAYPAADVDNLVKGALDALQGLALGNDSQVVRIVAEKRYAALGEEPRTELTVRRFD